MASISVYPCVLEAPRTQFITCCLCGSSGSLCQVLGARCVERQRVRAGGVTAFPLFNIIRTQRAVAYVAYLLIKVTICRMNTELIKK